MKFTRHISIILLRIFYDIIWLVNTRDIMISITGLTLLQVSQLYILQEISFVTTRISKIRNLFQKFPKFPSRLNSQ